MGNSDEPGRQGWGGGPLPPQPTKPDSGKPPPPTPPPPPPPAKQDSGTLTAKGVNGRVTFDGSWVTIERKGGLSRMTVGKGTKRIPVTSISAVQVKKPGPVINGYIEFTMAGGNENRAQFGSQTVKAASNENAVVYRRGHAGDFDRLRAAVEEAIAATNAPAGEPAEPPPAASMADELAKLAQLLRDGVLTQDEFDAQKARLLSH